MKQYIICTLMLSICILVMADLDYRPRLEIASDINDRIMFKTKAEIRYMNGIDHYYTAFDFGSEWQAAAWLTLSAYYRHINQYKDTLWTVEYRPIISGIAKTKVNNISFSNENKMEFRFKSSIAYRYINKMQIKLPPFSTMHISIYGGDEFAVNMKTSEISRNRIFCGFDMHPISKIRCGLCYIWEYNKSGVNWTPLQVIQSNIKYSF